MEEALGTFVDLLGIRAASTIACCDLLVLCFLTKAMQQLLFAPHQTPHQPTPSYGLPLGTSGDLCGPLWASLQTSADLSAHHSADLAADLCGPSTSRSLSKLMFCDKSHTKPLLFETRAHRHINFERMSHAKTRFPHETRKHACLSDVSHKNTTF